MSVHTDISIVIPCYDDLRVIRAITALRECDEARRAEILVCLNGSSREFTDCIVKYAGSLNARVLHTNTRGIAVARNMGIGEAIGEHIVFVDSDCWPFSRDYIKRIIEAVSEHEVVSGSLMFIPGRTRFGRLLSRLRNSDYARLKGPFFFCPNLAIRRSVIERAGLFDVRFKAGEDAEFGERLQRLGYQAVEIATAALCHAPVESPRDAVSKWFHYGIGQGLQLVRQSRGHHGSIWSHLINPYKESFWYREDGFAVALLRVALSLVLRVGMIVGWFRFRSAARKGPFH